ncbi:MAG: sensor histidine kinase [Chlorobi bacterium]|nr:sensor histidine kinase [Chlorobiota bacterium]
MKQKIFFIGFILLVTSVLGQSKTDSLIFKLRDAENDSIKLGLLTDIGDIYYDTNADSAIYYYEQAITLAEKLNDRTTIAECYISTGQCFEEKNLYKQSLDFFLNALTLYRELDDKEGLSVAYNNIGDSYSQLNSLAKALENYTRALSLYRELDDKDKISTVFIDIGNIYYAKKMYSKAKSYYSEALKICEELNDEAGISVCKINIGNVLSDQGSLDESIDYYKEALKTEQHLGSKEGIASVYNNIGDTYIFKGEYYRAIYYLSKSLGIAEEIGDLDLISLACLNISTAKIKQKKYNEAITFANRSLKLAKQIGNLNYQAENFSNLATAYEKLENYLKAYESHKIFDQLNDSILTKEEQKRFEQLDALYQLEKNQQEINTLTQDKKFKEKQLGYQRSIISGLIIGGVIFLLLFFLLFRQQKAKSKALKILSAQKEEIQKMHDEIEIQRDYLNELNATKDRFFSIMAHDLKNPFNSIAGFSDLMIENFEDLNEEENRRFLRLIKNASSQALNLLQNLLLWARSQTGNLEFQPTEVNIKERIIDTVSLIEIQAAKKNIKIQTEFINECYIKVDVNMLDTILRNLLSNAVKYTNINGEVTVSVNSRNNHCEISVKDNGIGISKKDIDKLFNIESKFSSMGTANEQGSGLGLILCKDFVTRHGGKIYATGEPGKGSEFTFTIPKA